MNYRITTLKSICIDKGLQTGPFGSQLKAEEYTSYGIPVIMPRDIVSGQINTQSIARVPNSKAISLSKHRLTSGDILFSRRGDLSKIAVVSSGEEGFLCGTGCLRARLNGAVNSDYLRYSLLTRRIIVWLEKHAVGQTMLNLNTKIISSLPLYLPNRNIQDKIAKTLTTWDRAIDLTERLIAEKQELRKGLTQQLLTGKKRLPGFGEKWQEVWLGNIFLNRTESERTDLSLVAITANRGIIPRDKVNRKDSSSANKSKYLRICPGDIAYNTMRMWQGVSGFSTLEGIVSPAYTIITPKEEIDGEFMALLFKFPHIVHLFYRHSQGLVSDTWNLKFHHFAEINVTIPDKTEQKAIAKVFRTIDRELDLLQTKADAIREQKKGLMQQLLTGKTRVKRIQP